MVWVVLLGPFWGHFFTLFAKNVIRGFKKHAPKKHLEIWWKKVTNSRIHFATVDHGMRRKTTECDGPPPPSNPYPGRATPAHPRAEALILLSLRIIRAKALVHYVYSSFPLSSHAGSADFLGPGWFLKSQIQPLERIVYTSRFSTRISNPCNEHIYHFHASELLNIICFNFWASG